MESDNARDKEILDWLLGRYISAGRRKKELEERLRTLDEERNNPIGGQSYDPMPHGSGNNDGAAGILLKISDVEEKILDQKRAAEESLVMITDILSVLPEESEEREVCELWYIDKMKWDEISSVTNWSARQCQRKKSDGLDYLLGNGSVQKRIRDAEPRFLTSIAIADERREKRKRREQKRLEDYDE